MKIFFLGFFSLLLSQFNGSETPSNTATTNVTSVDQKPGPDGMLPDLVVESITINHIDCGLSANWSVVICNNGEGPSPLTSAEIVVEAFPFDFDFSNRRVGALAPQTCTLLTGTVGLNSTGISMSVTVDPLDNVSESNDSNNNDIGFEMCY